MATTSKKSPAKKRRRRVTPRGKIKPHYGVRERGAALAMLDFNGGSVNKTAAQLKIPRMTLAAWSKSRVDDEAAAERESMRGDILGLLDDLLVDYARALRVKLLDKDTTLFNVQGGFGMLLDKRSVMLGRPTAISASLTGPSVAPSQRSEQAEAYEKIIASVIADAAALGEVITYDEAAAKIIELKPEAKEFLQIKGDVPS